ncbi:hypothetical protein [uncultured Croceitalea sp.]|uniref:hypothetical protein n=1 Tax=uncultured Croceitalea sp. TaxID=1798908 RepID=UPI0033059F3D
MMCFVRQNTILILMISFSKDDSTQKPEPGLTTYEIVSQESNLSAFALALEELTPSKSQLDDGPKFGISKILKRPKL